MYFPRPPPDRGWLCRGRLIYRHKLPPTQQLLRGLGRCLWPRLQTALVVMGFKLNPGAVEFFPASGHRRGKRADWRWTSVSKQQIRYAGGDERCGRRRVGLLNPLSGETHKQGMYLDRWTKQKISNRVDLVWFTKN